MDSGKGLMVCGGFQAASCTGHRRLPQGTQTPLPSPPAPRERTGEGKALQEGPALQPDSSPWPTRSLTDSGRQ